MSWWSRKRNSADKYLLIKRWGAGFWSDVDHVAGQIVAADIMGRIPVIDWGKAGPYADGASETFHLYFKPLNERSANLQSAGSIYPPSWNTGNIHEDFSVALPPDEDGLISRHKKKLLAKRERQLRYFRKRDEDVIVSVFHESIENMHPFIRRSSEYYGLGAAAIRRKIMHEKILLNERLRNEIARFMQRNARWSETVSIHLRGTDKIIEDDRLYLRNERAIETLDALCLKSGMPVFLMTDEDAYVERLKKTYGDRLIVSDSRRAAANGTAIHKMKNIGGYDRGRDIILDTYVAAACHSFIGNSTSNVARYVAAIGDFPPERLIFVDRME